MSLKTKKNFTKHKIPKMKSKKMLTITNKSKKMKSNKMRIRKMKFKGGMNDIPSTPSHDRERLGPDGTPIDKWMSTPSHDRVRLGPDGTPIDELMPTPSPRKDENTPFSKIKTKTHGTHGTEYDTYKIKSEKRKASERRARSRGITKKRPRQISF
mgnify:CR=1 FL=1|tara:strand:- start:1157 stop:1621 length:465 start_codon:yes stop_codon:yes gene_type:complete